MKKTGILVNGIATYQLPVLDRGLQYGDGFFTTLLVKRRIILNASCHWQRLQESARRLKFPDLNIDEIKTTCNNICQNLDNNVVTVLKIIITRGVGGRGYQPLSINKIIPTVIIQEIRFPSKTQVTLSHSMCDWNFWQFFKYIEVGVLQTNWGINSQLAGLKHLNRLENVLAQQELLDYKASWQEGLMLNENGHLISATQSNVVVYIDGKWLTPNVNCSGVIGTTLCKIMQLFAVEFSDIVLEELQKAKAMFCCNSIRGIMAVCKCHIPTLDNTEVIMNTKLVDPIQQQWQNFLEKNKEL